MRHIGAILLFGLASCTGSTGQRRVEIPVFARGSTERALQVGAATFTLTRAEIGFGPVYFCATEGAEVDLCEVDLAELLATITLDGLNPSALPIGVLQATTGSVRSALFDYGISWLLTKPSASPNPGAPERHSAVLAGRVDAASRSLTFLAEIDAESRGPGDAAVNARPTSHEITGRGDQLTLAVDPYRWLANIDVEQLFALDADGDGSVAITEEAQAYQAIVQGMTNVAPVEFEWAPASASSP